jgi:hypothetical protein
VDECAGFSQDRFIYGTKNRDYWEGGLVERDRGDQRQQ